MKTDNLDLMFLKGDVCNTFCKDICVPKIKLTRLLFIIIMMS